MAQVRVPIGEIPTVSSRRWSTGRGTGQRAGELPGAGCPGGEVKRRRERGKEGKEEKKEKRERMKKSGGERERVAFVCFPLPPLPPCEIILFFFFFSRWRRREREVGRVGGESAAATEVGVLRRKNRNPQQKPMASREPAKKKLEIRNRNFVSSVSLSFLFGDGSHSSQRLASCRPCSPGPKKR